MKKWLRAIRNAVGMGLIWAIGWGFVGLLIGLSIAFLPGLPMGVRESLTKALDPWPALALPGFFGGVVFGLIENGSYTLFANIPGLEPFAMTRFFSFVMLLVILLIRPTGLLKAK